METDSSQSLQSELQSSSSQSETLFNELKHEDIIIPLTYVTLKTEVENHKDCESGSFSETTTICAVGGYNIHIKTEENCQPLIINESQGDENVRTVVCNAYDIQMMATTSENEAFGINYEEEPVFVTLTTVKTDPEVHGFLEDEDDEYNDTKTICSLGGYEIDNMKSDNSQHLLEDSSQMPERSKEERDMYDVKTSCPASERDIFNIEYEEELESTNLSSAKNEPLDYIEDEVEYYNGYENDIQNVHTEEYTAPAPVPVPVPAPVPAPPIIIGTPKIQFQIKEVKVNEIPVAAVALPDDFPGIQETVRKHKGRKTHSCPVCRETYTRRVSLEKHLPIHFGYRPYGCYMCKIYFKNRSIRDVHVQGHFANHPFFCHMCMKPFMQMTHFKKHVRMRKGEKSYSCGFCGRSFVKRNTLEDHFHSHIAKRPHHCDICKKSFRMKWQYDKHQTKHAKRVVERTERKTYSCDKCEKTFVHKNSLIAHVEIHLEPTPVECDVCKKTFKDAKQLEEHAHTHKRNGSYFCEVCKKKYSMKARFYKHKCVQREKRFFGCGYCEKTFKWKSLLESHLSTHQVEVRYSCEVCKKGFNAKTSRDMHRRTHKNIYSCRICGKIFNEKITRDRHLRRHTLQERRSKMLMET